MPLNGIDPSAKTPDRIRRDLARMTKGAVTSTLNVRQPIALDTQGRLNLNTAANGGLTSFDVALAVNTDNATLEVNTNTVRVKAGGIGGTQLGVLTTKGDLLGFSTSHTRLGVGTDGQVLTADHTAATGLKWADASSGTSSPLTTKGDIWVFSTTDARLPVGTDGQVLSADSTAVTGLKWVPQSGGGFTGPTALTDGSTINIDATLNTVFTVTVAGNHEIETPTGGVDKQTIRVHVKQDNTGSRVWTLSPDFINPIFTITPTATAGYTDIIEFTYDDATTKWWVTNYLPGFTGSTVPTSFTDTFTRADAGTPGNNWSTLASIWSISSNTLVTTNNNSFTGNWCYRQSSEDTQNVRVELTGTTASGIMLVLARIDPAAPRAYAAYIDGSSLKIAYFNGSQSVLNSVSASTSAGTEYILKLSVTSTDATHTDLVATIATSASPGTIIATNTVTGDTTSALQNVAGSMGMANYNASTYTKFQWFAI